MEEARYVEACVAQQVVEDLYTDAFARQQITKQNRQEQVERLSPMYEALQRSRMARLQEEPSTAAREVLRNPVAQS